MAIGDGSAWDETTPVDATLVSQVDDYMRDVRIGVRGRLAFEHEWPSSQSATAEAGKHKFITLQNQSTRPTLSGTQVAAVYSKTSGSGLQELYWENEAGTELKISDRGNINLNTGAVLQVISTQNTTASTITATFPFTDAAPLVASGGQILTTTITPASATNKVMVLGQAFLGLSNNTRAAVVVFYATTAAGASVWNGNSDALPDSPSFQAFVVAGTTGAVTVSVRVGAEGGGLTVNGQAGTRMLGGIAMCQMRVIEVKA